MTSLKIAIASALAFGALLTGASQAQAPAAQTHIAALPAAPNGVEQCC